MARRNTIKGRNKTVLTESSKHAIATARAKKLGFKSFKSGTVGKATKSKISEGIAKKVKVVKRKRS